MTRGDGDRSLRFRERALADVEGAVQWYAEQEGERTANEFLDALAAAYTHIARHPRTGSPRWALVLNMAGLRSWTLDRYPWLVFYVQRGDHIEVLRVLHAARDITAALAGSDTFESL